MHIGNGGSESGLRPLLARPPLWRDKSPNEVGPAFLLTGLGRLQDAPPGADHKAAASTGAREGVHTTVASAGHRSQPQNVVEIADGASAGGNLLHAL